MKRIAILLAATTAMAFVPGPRGLGGAQLWTARTAAWDVQFGGLNHIQKTMAMAKGSPMAWGSDALGNLVFLGSDYKLYRTNASDTVSVLAASTSFDLSLSGARLLHLGPKVFYTKASSLWSYDLNSAQREEIALGEIAGELAGRDSLLFHSASLLKQSLDGGHSWTPVILADQGTMRTCQSQILILGANSYSFLNAQNQWVNVPWTQKQTVDFGAVPLTCWKDTIAFAGSQSLQVFTLGSSAVQAQTVTGLSWNTITSIASDSTSLYFANDSATWSYGRSQQSLARVGGLSLQSGADPIWTSKQPGLVSDNAVWTLASNWQKAPALGNAVQYFALANKTIGYNQQGKIFELDSAFVKWNQVGALPASQSDLMNVGPFLLAEQLSNQSRFFSKDLGQTWQSLPLGDLQNSWMSSNGLLCGLIDAVKDSLFCSNQWTKTEIPYVVSSVSPTISALGSRWLLADGFGTWASTDSAKTWSAYGDQSQPQIAQVFDLGSGRALALAAFPGWRMNADLWSRARLSLMSTVDGGQSWHLLSGADSAIWNLSPVSHGDTVLMASTMGDLYTWDLGTGSPVVLDRSGQITPVQDLGNLRFKVLGPHHLHFQSSQKMKVQIVDFLGRNRWDGVIEIGESNLNLADFEPGWYALRTARGNHLFQIVP